MLRKFLIAPLGWGIIIFLLLAVWAATGGLWTPHRDRPVIIAALSRQPSSLQSHPGTAERVSNFLFGGQNIPGFSRAPNVAPSASQRRTREAREATRKVRLLTERTAARDLQRRLGGIPKDNLTLLSWGERKWIDSKLGCAAPNDIAIGVGGDGIPGWIFVYRAAAAPDTVYTYHSTRDGTALRYCGSEVKIIE